MRGKRDGKGTVRVDEIDEVMPPIESLRKLRADRRAQRRRRVARVLRKLLLTMPQGAPATRLAKLHADNPARCSCRLCRPYKSWRQLDRREKRQRERERDAGEQDATGLD